MDVDCTLKKTHIWHPNNMKWNVLWVHIDIIQFDCKHSTTVITSDYQIPDLTAAEIKHFNTADTKIRNQTVRLGCSFCVLVEFQGMTSSL